ncbi:MAG TPA: hypothetical protein VJ874_06985 [Candidatus Thermoplasmatota archaeon]|nr:hypothetical protein [Candidatus Thermoplasmatota archaeon]
MMPIRKGRRFQDDRQGSAQTLSLMVAGAIFMGVVSAVVLVSHDGTEDRAAADSATDDIQAASLADVLLGSPGIGWSDGADQIGRLGLGASNGSGLAPSSILALKGAMELTAANSKVDYADAKASLGLDPAGSQEFHIRMYPVGMDTVYDASLSGIRLAYVADFVAAPDVTLPIGTLPTEYANVANAKLNESMRVLPSTAVERSAIKDMGLDFTDRVHLSTASASVNVLLDQLAPLPDQDVVTLLTEPSFEGDVYPDIKAYLEVLPARLSQYEILLIGSGVDHSSLTSNSVKESIKNWTLAGGTLVVMGSEGQSYQWLQPLFHTGVSTVNGAAMAPDVSHPVLKEPNELSWTSYDSHGRGWDIKDTGSGAHYDDFSHIIVQGGEDVFAISKDGAFGTGRIVLTTYMPREIGTQLGTGEAMGFLENIVLYADHTNLYLEYGPAAPLGEPISIAVRQSWLWDDVLGQVPVRLEVQTWG